jgi:hypothetical protein
MIPHFFLTLLTMNRTYDILLWVDKLQFIQEILDFKEKVPVLRGKTYI